MFPDAMISRNNARAAVSAAEGKDLVACRDAIIVSLVRSISLMPAAKHHLELELSFDSWTFLPRPCGMDAGCKAK